MIESSWPLFRLHEVVGFQEGPGILAKDFTAGGVPLVRLAGLGGYEATLQGCNYVDARLADSKWNHFKLQRGDILVSTSASFGRPAVVGAEAEGAIFYTGIIRFRSNVDHLDNGYLKIFLGSKLFLDQAEAFASGSVIRHFGPSHLRQMLIPLPPVGEQRAIASVLSALDDKTDLNRRMNETLEAMARSIFKDWFVDFGPTRAKVEGGAPYLAPEIWSLFPDLLDGEGKPQGWPLGRLDDLLSLQRGFDLPSSTRRPGDFVVMAASGPNGFHDEFMVRGPGVTTGRSGVIGRVFFVMEDFWPLNTSLWVKEFKLSSPLHAYFLLQTLDFESFNAGSAVPTLNRNHVHNLRMPTPPKAVVDAFDTYCMPLMRTIRANERHSETLAITRDLLLPKLMSGEIRVRDAEKIAEAAQ